MCTKLCAYAATSIVIQVVVPMDVVSSRLMVGSAPPPTSAAAPASGAVHRTPKTPVSTPPSTGARSGPPNMSPALAKSPDSPRTLSSSARASSGASPATDAAARAHRSGLHMARHILRTEGVAGLYRYALPCIHYALLRLSYVAC